MTHYLRRICVDKYALLAHVFEAQGSMAMANEKVRMNLQVSAELNDVLDKIADDTGSNRSEVIRQALALMKVAHEAKQKGKRLGIVSDPSKLETEIVGLL
jgi:Arc/MetJ-type ribon-helix-helix transcriptional regulator